MKTKMTMKDFVKWITLVAICLLLPFFSRAVAEKSGSCGTGVYYTFDEETGLLSITGNGTMSPGAWDSYKSNIIHIEIQEGVKNICQSAFSGCSSAVSVSIPQSVTSIGGYAFYGCSSLESVTIPEGVTELTHHVFTNCTSTTFYLHDNITTIAKYMSSSSPGAFYGCSGKIYCSIGSKTAIQLGKDVKWYRTPDNPDRKFRTQKHTFTAK